MSQYLPDYPSDGPESRPKTSAQRVQEWLAKSYAEMPLEGLTSAPEVKSAIQILQETNDLIPAAPELHPSVSDPELYQFCGESAQLHGDISDKATGLNSLTLHLPQFYRWIIDPVAQEHGAPLWRVRVRRAGEIVGERHLLPNSDEGKFQDSNPLVVAHVNKIAQEIISQGKIRKTTVARILAACNESGAEPNPKLIKEVEAALGLKGFIGWVGCDGSLKALLHKHYGHSDTALTGAVQSEFSEEDVRQPFSVGTRDRSVTLFLAKVEPKEGGKTKNYMLAVATPDARREYEFKIVLNTDANRAPLEKLYNGSLGPISKSYDPCSGLGKWLDLPPPKAKR